MSKFGKTLIVAALTVFSATSALAYDRPNNPPGPVGGPGTDWHNPPGPVGGPGASPYVHHPEVRKFVVIEGHRYQLRYVKRHGKTVAIYVPAGFRW